MRSSRRTPSPPGATRADTPRPALVALVATLTAIGLLSTPDATATTDGVPSFSESPGCGAHNGDRGPQMGPGPYDSSYPYSALPDSAELHGTWADYYGRTIGEVRGNLVAVNLPGLAKDLYIHERVLPAFNQVLANLAAEAAKGNVYEIRSDTWSFNPATIPPGRHLSFHGVGAAIDVNSTTNPYRGDNLLVTDMPTWFVDAWRDAGWCWGGDWVSVKDPMHFAWMGPIHTPDHGPDPAPFPSDYAASGFATTRAVANALQATLPSAAHFGIDIDRDGAPDFVRFQQSYQTGAFRIEAAQGWRRFETCTASGWASNPGVATDAVVMGDYDRDARPEVWIIDESGPTVTVSIHTVVQQFGGGTAITGTPQHLITVTTAAPVVAGSTYAVADHDRDGSGDLYVITPGTTTAVSVWAGPSFDTALVDTTVAIATDDGWRFALGDHDLDVVPDLYALSGGGPATLGIARGAGGFTSTPASITTGVTPVHGESLAAEDYDGDGRDDLYLVDGDGSARIVLGGVRAVGADLDGWFVKVDLSWGWGSGCVGPSNLRITTDPPVASQISIDGVPFDTWGLTWVKVPPGTYTVSFSDVEGFSTPSSQTVTVTEGATTVVGSFTQRGFLRVFTDPPLPATVSVDGVERNDWGVWTDLPAGDYAVCFGPVADYTPPACQTATVTPGGTTEMTGTYAVDPGAAAATDFGMLRVTTDPPLPSQIIVDGVARDSWGLNWLKIPATESLDVTVTFSDVAGYATPAAQTVTIVPGETTTVTGSFVQRGWIQVSTSPAVAGTVLVDGIPRNDWGTWTDLTAGDYEVCFGEVTGYTPPACQTVTVTAGATTALTGLYG